MWLSSGKHWFRSTGEQGGTRKPGEPTGRRQVTARNARQGRGDVVASCDADGAIKLWDVRTVTEIGTIHVSTHPVNKVCFDRSGTRIVCAGDDGLVHGYSTDDLTNVPHAVH